jgi:uncharacterized protein with von Willebrand factor type A (vWA) domain
MHFARLLRRAGLPVGPAETIAATTALTFIDIGAFQAALRAVMVHRHEHADLFDAAFAMYWRNPDAAKFAAALAALDGLRAPEEERAPPGARRLAEAMRATKNNLPPPETAPQTIDAVLTFSEAEKLNMMDFESMTATDVSRAKTEITKLHLPLDEHRTRRFRPSAIGRRTDLRATIRRSLATGGEILAISRATPKIKPPPLVVLCDISGSMSRYAEIMLHFVHALANDRDHVTAFLFGTRLSNISRQLKNRDPETAFAAIAAQVPDWSGGTRIGEAIAAFNNQWSRRVLGQGAVVLLLTDGLDREGAKGLAAAMERLHRSSRRLIWLNPLLRWEGFSPKTQGARAMLPHVDEFRPVHNLASLKSLITSLSSPPPPRGAASRDWS